MAEQPICRGIFAKNFWLNSHVSNQCSQEVVEHLLLFKNKSPKPNLLFFYMSVLPQPLPIFIKILKNFRFIKIVKSRRKKQSGEKF